MEILVEKLQQLVEDIKSIHDFLKEVEKLLENAA